MHESEFLKGYYKNFAFPNEDQRNVEGKWWPEFVFELSQLAAEM